MTAPTVILDDPAPDWESSPDVCCPLCGYNLRGLSEPRCPECGYRAATWRALIDETAWRHPYLFEHHPRRHLLSFFKTLVMSWLPSRFWKQLAPEHRPKRGWLLCYWILVILLMAAVFGGYDAIRGLAAYSAWNVNVTARRNAIIAYYNSAAAQQPVNPLIAQIIARYGSIPNYVSATLPQPTLWLYIRWGMRSWWAWRELIGPWMIPVLWPWLSMGALMIFAESMRQARVLPVQVMRCVIYCAGSIVPLLALLIVAIHLPVFQSLNYTVQWPIVFWGMGSPMVATLVLGLALLTVHLAIAYRRYLHFRQPVMTVLLAQTVGFLLFVTAHLVIFSAAGYY
jgi:hypothetical protein